MGAAYVQQSLFPELFEAPKDALPAEYARIAKELAARLQLARPIAFLDLETTGTSVQNDRIVEIAVVRIFPDGHGDVRSERVDPEMPIPAEATAVHKITDADVHGMPAFRDLAPGLAEHLANCDIGGFGVVRFDLKLLEAEFRRARVSFSMDGRFVVDAMAIFFDREPRNLGAAVKFYCGKEFEEAHAAREDVLASIEVLAGQLERYQGLPASLPELDDIAVRRKPDWIDGDGKLVWLEGEPAIGFGKNRGKTLKSLASDDPGYLDWIIRGDFSETVKGLVREALRGA